MSYFNDLNSFYRIFSQADTFGKISVRDSSGTTQTSADVSEYIYNNYIGRVVSGKDIIANLKKPPSNSQPPDGVGKGYLFNTLFQAKDSTKAEVLDEEYWKHESYGSSDTSFAKITPLPRGENFYAEVCGVVPIGGRIATPPVNLTINVLRTPRINPSLRNVDEIEFFLNNMPPVFASQMVPYFEVEFQLPRTNNVAIDSKNKKTALLNRTSLLRFLMGSEVDLNKLKTSEADRSLVATFQDPQTKKLSYFTGMEMFTTPQTLTNMDSLGVQNADNAVRLNPVAPFMPPATLTQGSIKMMNAGAGTFSRCMADIEFKLHDRARLPEFAEFLRGPSGYGGHDPITVWITYGWLAPRGRGEEDMYAKFINENMLVKRAFQFKNAGYSFDTLGQCTIKIELVSKGDHKAESQSIDTITDDTTKNSLKMLQQAALDAQNLSDLLGNPAKGFGKEVRVFQIIDATAGGQTGYDIDEKELKTVSSVFEDLGKSIDSNPNLDTDKKAMAKLLIKNIRTVYDPQNLKLLKNALRKHSLKKLEKCSDANSPDPFIPLRDDLKSFKGASTPKPFFTPDLVKATYEVAPPPGNSTRSGTNGKNIEKPHNPIVGWVSGANRWIWEDTGALLTESELQEAGKTNSREELLKGRDESMRLGRGGFQKPKQKQPASPAPATPTSRARARKKRRGRMRINIPRNKSGKILKHAAGSKQSKATGPIAPSVKRNVISFGKLFCAYCLPALLAGASNEDIDEVQVNFYQINESCGPVSLHNLAEFPIDLAQFTEQYSEYFIRRGGDQVTLHDFLEFVSMYCFGDRRSPGYGMKTYYAAYDAKNEQPAPAKDEQQLQSSLSSWFGKYGDFKQPSLTVSSEVLYQNDHVNSKSDLLYQLASTVGPAYKGPVKGKKIIKRIHIYDATLDQYANLRKEVLRGANEYAVLSKELSERLNAPNAKLEKDGISVGDVKIIGSGKDVLRDFLGYTVPTITYGANGTMITNATLASKMDGLMATAALLGGSQRAKSTTTPNGLAMSENTLPLRLLPAQMTMNTYGCPIAQLYQQYFIDFGTGTTIDNVYSVTQVNHTFSPGKFETSWTFVYSDGYGRFYNATALNDSVKNLIQSIQTPPNTPAGGNSTSIPAK